MIRERIGDVVGRPGGAVDHRKVKAAVLASVSNRVCDVFGTTAAESLASFIVRAVKYDRSVDRPAVEFSRSTDAEQDDGMWLDRFNNCANEQSIALPRLGRTPNVATCQRACGVHECVPVKNCVCWQASLKQRRERRLPGARSAEYGDQHLQSLPQSAPTRRVPIGSYVVAVGRSTTQLRLSSRKPDTRSPVLAAIASRRSSSTSWEMNR